ncbi:Nuf2 family-domain-containing protein [Entophlyctis helioformis]|nr:Nuf2 family-domain-containing protein [Entophlyctis helioformis]
MDSVNGPGTFPTLDIKTVRECLASMDIAVTTEELVKPSPQRMFDIFEHITILLQDVEAAQFEQPTFATLEMLDYPDIHKDSLSLIAFYRHLRKLIVQLGVPDFSLSDILNPQKNRVILILSAIINFCKFREERMQVFHECSTQSAQLVEDKAVLERRNADMAELVNQLKAKRAQEQPEVDRLRAVNNSLAADLRELKKAQTTLGTEIDNIKKEQNALRDKQVNNQYLVTSLKQDCFRLKSRVVHSPEKLKQVIIEMNRLLLEDKALVVSSEKKTRELLHKIDLMNSVEQEILACQKIMTECNVEQKRAEEAAQRLSADLEVIEQKKADLKGLEVKEQQLQRQVKSANEKIARLEKHQSAKQSASMEKIAALKEEHEQLSNERAAAQARADENERVATAMEDKIAQLRKKMESELSLIWSDYERLLSELNVYQQSLLNTMF